MSANPRADPNPLTELDKAHLADVIARHPGCSIRVDRGFGDGDIGRDFGYVPNDWNGVAIDYSFLLVSST